LARWAAAIAACYEQRSLRLEPISNTDAVRQWRLISDKVNDLLQSRDKAAARGFTSAVAHYEQRIASATHDLHYYTDVLNRKAKLWRDATQPSVSAELIYQELAGIDAECKELEFRSGVLTLHTIPIACSGIELGRFEVKLDVADQFYNIDAVWSTRPDEYQRAHRVHPHVNEHKLCAGAGAVVISEALKSGRFYDFVQVVQGVLSVHNPESDYHSLEAMSLNECYECGGLYDRARRCCVSGELLCRHCGTRCGSCDYRVATNFAETCSGCHSSFCNNCLATCEACDKKFCSNCKPEDLCDECKAEQDESDEADESDMDVVEETEAEETETAV
jgi:hypothetical protein